jgi:hypothetical protein
MKTQTDHRSRDDEMMAIAPNGARTLDERELESDLRRSLRGPLKKHKPGHFAALAQRKKTA